MAEITAQIIKNLREKTGAGMMDCKKALVEVQGNFEEAVDWLRKKGLAAAAKKSGRTTAEGLVGVITEGTWGAVLEVNSETDFVARNEQFQAFVKDLLAVILKNKISTRDQLMQTRLESGKIVEEELSDQIAVIGENLAIRRLEVLSVPQGKVVSYMHNILAPSLGKIGVLVGLESEAEQEELQHIGHQVAMHVAALTPLFLDVSSVDQDVLKRERAVLTEQAKDSNRPAEVIEKMVEGRLRKYCEDVVLKEQVFVLDNKTKIKDFIIERAKTLGSSIELTGFHRLQLGEGIEKEESDFAAEVKAISS